MLLSIPVMETNSLPASLTVPEHTAKLELLMRALLGAYLVAPAGEFMGEEILIEGIPSSGQLIKGFAQTFTGTCEDKISVAPNTTIRVPGHNPEAKISSPLRLQSGRYFLPGRSLVVARTTW